MALYTCAMNLRNAACTCGSGKRYKHCCGSISATKTERDRPTGSQAPVYTEAGWFKEHLRGESMARFCPAPAGTSLRHNLHGPPGVLIVPRFLDAEICADWCQHLSSQRRADLEVQHEAAYKESGKVQYEKHSARVTQAVEYTERKHEIVREVTRSFSECVMPFFNVQLAAFEPPTVLRYGPGGKYGPHSDNELWDSQQRLWLKTLNRDFSILIYLNEDFEGGALSFPNFQYKIRPETGMLVAFPSDHRYLHAAEPLISGERYAIVSWGAREKRVEPEISSLA